MIDPWVNLLNDRPLSKSEREVLKRYQIDPTGRSFLPLADVLRAHKLVEESLELLTQGVERHPGFTVARVVLVRELLNRGMVADAWRVFEESPVSLRDNVLAQKLRFRLAVLLGLQSIASSTLQHMKSNQMLDPDTKRLADSFEALGIKRAREQLTREFVDHGISLMIPPGRESMQGNESPISEERIVRVGSQPPPKSTEWSREIERIHAFQERPDGQELEGFHVVPLEEILQPGAVEKSEGRTRSPSGIELDSTTLADIYAKQGHYGKAFAIYRRLLKLSPNSDLLRRRVAELARLKKDQKESDMSIDPSLVDKMESLEIIDRQIKFLEGLLDRLT